MSIKTQICRLAVRGVRQVDIAAKLGVSQSLVSKVLKRHGINSHIRGLKVKAVRAATEYARALRMSGADDAAEPWAALATLTANQPDQSA